MIFLKFIPNIPNFEIYRKRGRINSIIIEYFFVFQAIVSYNYLVATQ